jgi:hypothetical protein
MVTVIFSPASGFLPSSAVNAAPAEMPTSQPSVPLRSPTWPVIVLWRPSGIVPCANGFPSRPSSAPSATALR